MKNNINQSILNISWFWS